jgi:putative copper resistance protein D
MTPYSLYIAFNVLDFCALFGLCGLLVSKALILPPQAFGTPGLLRQWRRMLGIVLFVLTLTGIVLLILRTLEMSGSSLAETLPLVATVLFQTHFGHIWTIHLIAIVILWIGWIISFSRLSSRNWMALMMSVMLILIYTYSASSHASDQGDFTLSEFNDWLHVLSTSIWGGSILSAALLIFPALLKQPQQLHSLIAAVVYRLSSVSAVALAIVLVTGIYNTKLRLGDFSALFNTEYGHLLAIKLIFVSTMILIGVLNRFIFVPRIAQWVVEPISIDDKPVRQIIFAMGIDAALVLLTLIATAMLFHGMPPASTKIMSLMPGM